jgi:hypothetical protein
MNNRNSALPHHTCSQTPSGEPSRGEDSVPPQCAARAQLSKRTQALRAANQPGPATNHIPIRRASGLDPPSYRRDRRRSTEVPSDVESRCARAWIVIRLCAMVWNSKNGIPPGQSELSHGFGNDIKYDGVLPPSWRVLEDTGYFLHLGYHWSVFEASSLSCVY